MGHSRDLNEAMHQRLEGQLHEAHGIEMAAIAYCIFRSIDKVRNAWPHETGGCQEVEYQRDDETVQ